MRYTKPPLTYDEQADLVIDRGMICARDELIERLRRVGYYRLSGYWYTFRNSDDSFKQGTSLEIVWKTYTFDRQFRLLVLDAIERVEVWLRTALAYELSQTEGAFGYTAPSNLPNLSEDSYRSFIKKCHIEYKRSQEGFVNHFKERYGDSHSLPPYWMLVATMDFGQMLTLYKGAPNSVKNAIASQVDVKSQVLKSWLVSLNTVRNICAHHARLWNRQIGTKPIIPHDKRWHIPYEVKPGKIFGILMILSYLLKTIAPNTKWRQRLSLLLEDYSTIPKHQMGFTSGWESSSVWRVQ